MDGLHVLLKKIIRSGTGRSRYLMAMTGLSVAVILILAAIQLQADYQDLLYSKNNRDSIANFLVINKRITDQNLGATGLTDRDIKNLEIQPYVESIGLLTPSRFKASVQSASDRFPFYTDIAFESVPKEFIDITAKDWTWNEHSAFIPIIAPNMFLDFYNFQFSFSQNLPQLTQQVVKMIVFKVNLYGPNGSITFNGRVVGFSDRISSLLVPEEFMKWGNSVFGKNGNEKPSRVIIKTRDAGAPELTAYLKENNLTTDADKTRFSKYRRVVDMVVSISGITGIILFAFALLVFTLFIQLTVASSREDIRLLISLGTSPSQLRRFLLLRFVPTLLGILFLSFLVVGAVQFFLSGQLISQAIYINKLPAVTTLLGGLCIALIVWMVTGFSIRNCIKEP